MEPSDRLEDRYPYYPNDPVNKANFSKQIRPDEVFAAFGHGCVPKLVKLLLHEPLPEAKRIHALELLRDECKSVERRAEAVAHGALEACTALLTSLATEVKSLAAAVISALLVLRSARVRVLGFPCVESLAVLLLDAAAEVRGAGAKALLVYVSNQDGAEVVAENAELTSRIVDALPDLDESREVNHSLLESLALVARTKVGVATCLEAHCAAKLAELAGRKDERVLVAHIANKLAAFRCGKQQLIHIGLVPVLGTMLRDTSADVRREASGALMAICVERQGKLEVGEGPLVEALCRCLEDPSMAVRDNICEAIRSASEIPAVRKAFVHHLVLSVDNLERVFGAQCAATLFEILAEQRELSMYRPAAEKELVAALTTLTRLASTPQGSEEVFGCLYSVERPAALLRHGNPVVERLAGDLIGALCAHNGPSAQRRLDRATLRPETEAEAETKM